jgi:hypothetical protein
VELYLSKIQVLIQYLNKDVAIEEMIRLEMHSYVDDKDDYENHQWIVRSILEWNQAPSEKIKGVRMDDSGSGEMVGEKKC